MFLIEANLTLLILVAYDLEAVIPAAEIAWKESSALYPNIHFNRTIFINPNPSGCTEYESVVGNFLANFYYKNVYPVKDRSNLIILPAGCSFAMVYVSELSREWNVPVIASAGVDSRLGNKKRYPTLIRMLPSQISAYSMGLKELLDFYNWTCVTIICDPNSSENPFYKQICIELSEILKGSKEGYNVYAFSTNLLRRELRESALKTAKSQSTVIVILAHMDLVRQVLVMMLKLRVLNQKKVHKKHSNLVTLREITADVYGMLSNDYVYITAVYFNFPTTYCGSPHWYRNDSFDELAKRGFESLLLVSLSDPVKSTKLEKFLTTIQTDYLPKYNTSAISLIEEMQLVAICVHTAFNAIAKVANDTLAVGESLSDGIRFSRKMYNQSFDSVAGTAFKVNLNGDRDSLYTVLGISNRSGTHGLEPLLYYDARDGRISISTLGLGWIKANTTLHPGTRCGVTENLSDNQQAYGRVLIPTVVVAFLMFPLFGIGAYLIIKHRTSRLETWLILPEEIGDFNHTNKLQSLLKHSSGLYQKNCQNLSEDKLLVPAADTRKIFLYKGQLCWCKRYHPLSQKLILTKKDRNLLNYRNNMFHVNIGTFYGLCFSLDDLKIISEYSPKGTLYDILLKGNLNSTLELKYSLIFGLVSGLKVIHASLIGVHGSLSSTSCLVDHRFTVRLTDFGLRCVNFQIDKNIWNETRNMHKLLYFAPEILKNKQVEQYPAFTKEGDIYAFAILLHQLLFCCGPFGLALDDISLAFSTSLVTAASFASSPQSIIDRLTKNKMSQQPYRPIVPQEKCDPKFCLILSDCWAEDQHKRPTIHKIAQQIKKIKGLDSDKSFLEAALRRLEEFSEDLELNVINKTMELEYEKRNTDELLFQLIPKPLVLQLHRGSSVPPELFEEVTVCFTAVSNFLMIVTTCAPIGTINFLNGVFLLLDNILASFNVYKIETIADSYMVASGLPLRNGYQHAKEIAKMALAMISKAKLTMVLGTISGPLQLQIGVHTGVCAASIIGTKKPRYCLFGDTINTASRMTTSGEALQIQVSNPFAEYILQHFPGEFLCNWRGTIAIKGKGDMNTFWLTGVT